MRKRNYRYNRDGASCVRKTDRKIAWAMLAAPVALAMVSNARAASLTWDSGGTHPTHPVDGSGNWDSLTADWSNGTTDVVWDNVSTAIFGNSNGIAGTATIDDASGKVTAAGLTFNAATSGSYTIAASGADTLALSGTSPVISVSAGVNATISAPITGAFGSYANGATITGLLIKGLGTLTLSGVETYTGSTIIENNGAANTGTAVILSGGSLGTAAANVYVGLNPTAAATDTSALTLNGGTITASSLVINYNFGEGLLSTTAGSTVNVQGTSTINADTIAIDGETGRTSGNAKGGDGSLILSSGATLTLNGASGVGNNVTLLDIANYYAETGGATGTGMTGTADFSLGTVNGTINTIDIATGKAGTGVGGAGTAAASMLFANGTLSAGTISIARFGSQAAVGTLSLVAGGTGTLTAGTGAGSQAITFGATGQGTQGSGTVATGTINIAGATLNVNGDILNNPAASVRVSTATINLTGGILNMQGNNIAPSGSPITLNAAAGTLENLNTINGAGGLTTTGTGAQVLNLLGTNAYTGNTTIGGGTVIVGAATAMGTGAGALIVNGGTLDLHGFSQSVAGLSGTGAGSITTNNGVSLPATLTVTGGTGNYTGVLKDGSSPTALTLTGGTVNFTAATAQTYTGNTTVNSGATLTIANINSTTNTTVNGSLTAAGTLGILLLDQAGSITPGPTVASNSTGTLNASTFTLGSGGGSLNFLVNSLASFDQLSLSGAATLNGNLTVNASLSSSAQSATYALLSAPAGLNLNGHTVTPNITVVGGGSGTTRISGLIQETSTQIQLVVTGSPANLTWTGAADNTSWDIVNHQNWTSTAPSDPNRFYNADIVNFPSVTAPNQTVVVAAGVLPGSVQFTNDGTHPYTIQGSGIGGGGGLTVSGGGQVTLQNLNTYAGNTAVSSGSTLVVDSTGAIAGGTLSVASGAAATVNAGGQITATTLNISGNLNNSGTVVGTTLTLSSPAVAIVSSTGTLSTPTVAINGGSLTVQPSGLLSGTSYTVASGASLSVAAGGSITNAPSLVNNGSVTFNSDQIIGSLSGTDPTATVSETGTLTVGHSGTYAGIIQDDGPGSLTVTANTLTLTGANLYTGATTINTGANLIVDIGANTGSLSAATAITANGTLIYGRTGAQSLSNTISGSGAIRQTGGGTIALTGNNSAFTGAIQAYNGTILQNDANSFGTAAGGFVLGTPEPAGAPSTTPVGNITLVSSVPIPSVGSISSTSGSITANPTANVLTIPAGVTLTDGGALTVGPNNATAAVFSTLAVRGGGSLIVNGTVNVSQTNSVAVLDLSALNSVTINGAFNILGGAGQQGTVTLANTTVNSFAPANFISTGTINIATTGTSDPNGNASVLNLGSGTNIINASAINLGSGRGNGVIQFVAGAPSTASVTITGNPTIILADASTNGTQTTGTSALNLAGFNANVQAGAMTIAQNFANLAGGASAAVTFDTGTFGAGTVTIGMDNGGSSPTGPTGILTIGGAVPDNTATGAFSSGNIVLGSFTTTNGAADSSAVATATFTINGGSATINGSITNNSTRGTTVSTLNLAGGKLDMTGNSIGGSGAVNSGTGPITVNLPSTGQTATLANLGGGGINGAGLTMNGAGTLTLDGNNTYAGNTTVNTSGTMILAATGTLPASTNLTVSTGGLARFATATQRVVTLNTLTPTGKLDMTNNAMILQNGVLSDITNQLKAGFNAGAGYWNGPTGIVSTTAAADTRFLTTLGSGMGGNPLDTVPTNSTEVLVKYTYYGDADLNGMVNGADYQQIDNGFGMGLTGWSNGDFNYDGVVNGSDFALIDNTFNQITATGAASLAILADSASLIAIPAATGAVPEPASFGICGIAVASLFARRRRTNR